MRDYSLRDLFWTIKRNVIFIVGACLIFTAVALGVVAAASGLAAKSSESDLSYSAYADVQISAQPSMLSNSDVAYDYEYNPISNVLNSMPTYTTLLKSEKYTNEAAEKLGGEFTASQIASMVSFKQLTSTSIIRVTAVSNSPKACSDICQVYSDIICEVTDRVILAGTAVPLGVSEPISELEAGVNTKLIVAIVLLLALFISCAVFVIRDVITPIVDDAEDIELLHKAAFIGRVKRKKGEHALLDARVLSRAAHMQLARDKKRVVLVTGCCDAERVAKAAKEMAEHAARSGEAVVLAEVSAVKDTKAFDIEYLSAESINELINKLNESPVDKLYIVDCGAADNGDYISALDCAAGVVVLAQLHKTKHGELSEIITDASVAGLKKNTGVILIG